MPKEKPKTKSSLRYDLGCGKLKQDGFTGVDITKKGTKADIELDLLKFPWPWEDNSVDEIFCAHFIEHIPHGNGSQDPFFEFFNEVYRVMKPNAIAKFVAPYYTSIRAWQDPTHQRAISEATFLYLTKQWRDIPQNDVAHYPIKCNFDIQISPVGLYPDWEGRPQEAVQYALAHYWNVALDIMAILKKI